MSASILLNWFGLVGGFASIHEAALLTTLFLIWLLPAYLVARLAKRRGRSFMVFLLAALFVPGWPLTLLVALIVPRRRNGSSAAH
jgi:hypothetical protein